MDPAFAALDDDDTDEEDDPRLAEIRQEKRDLLQGETGAKKIKYNPPMQNPAVMPSVNGNAAGSARPIAPRYEIPRSVSPIDIRNRRSQMLCVHERAEGEIYRLTYNSSANLSARAERAVSSEVVHRLIQKASEATTGNEQIIIMLQAINALRSLTTTQTA